MWIQKFRTIKIRWPLIAGNLPYVSNKLKKKLVFTLGENFTAEEKDAYLEQLQNQKTEIEKEIKKFKQKKTHLCVFFRPSMMQSKKPSCIQFPN